MLVEPKVVVASFKRANLVREIDQILTEGGIMKSDDEIAGALQSMPHSALTFVEDAVKKSDPEQVHEMLFGSKEASKVAFDPEKMQKDVTDLLETMDKLKGSMEEFQKLKEGT